MQCAECGGTIVKKGYEYFCTSCGLVYSVETIPGSEDYSRRKSVVLWSASELGTNKSRVYNPAEEKRLSRILRYVSIASQDWPKSVRNRAMFLAKANYHMLNKRESLKGYAIACVEIALREYKLGTIVGQLDKKTRRKVMRFLRRLDKPEFTIEERTQLELRKLCTKLGVSYKECYEFYVKHRDRLSGRTPKVVAATVVRMVCNEVTNAELCKEAEISTSALRRAVNAFSQADYV